MNIVLKQLTVVVATSLVVIIVSKLVTTSKGDVLSSNTASSDQASLTPTITAPPSPVPTAVPSPTVEPIPEPTVEPTLKPSLEPTPTPTITPTSTITPTPTQAPDIYALTESYAHEYSIDPNLLRHIAQCESGFNPSASHLDYAGLYQFSSSAWRKYRLQQSLDPNPELRLIAEEAIHTAAYVLSIGHSQIWPSCMP